MEEPEGSVPRLPDEVWAEIRRYLDQEELIQAQIDLARTSKQLYAVFGGYAFVQNQEQLNQALANPDPVTAIVLLPEAGMLTVEQAPAAGQVPIVSYGETAVTAGSLHVRAPVHITASGDAYVQASGSATVTASGDAEVHAHNSVTVTASGDAGVNAHGSATVTASGDAKVWAYDQAQVAAYGTTTVKAYGQAEVAVYDSAKVAAEGTTTAIGEGDGVVIFWAGDLQAPSLQATDRTTIRQIGQAEVHNSFDQLERDHPAPGRG
jgi:hypothetical protein